MTQEYIARSFIAQLQNAIEDDARQPRQWQSNATREERVQVLEDTMLRTLLDNEKLTAIAMKVLETGGFALDYDRTN